MPTLTVNLAAIFDVLALWFFSDSMIACFDEDPSSMLKSFGQATLALSLLATSPYVWAQAGDAVQSPAFKAGDAWLFDDVSENGATGYSETHSNVVIERVDDKTMTVGVKREGAPTAFEDHVLGTDWSQRRFLDNQQVVTGKPLEFPLTVGRKWMVDFVDPTHRGNQVSLHAHRTYSVVGWEDITVPAGHFHAVKITSDGVDEAMIEMPASAGASAVASSAGTASISHAQRGGVGKLVRVTHSEFFYVPAIKNAVRSIEEQYNIDNVRVFRKTRNLISFTPSA